MNRAGSNGETIGGRLARIGDVIANVAIVLAFAVTLAPLVGVTV